MSAKLKAYFARIGFAGTPAVDVMHISPLEKRAAVRALIKTEIFR